MERAHDRKQNSHNLLEAEANMNNNSSYRRRVHAFLFTVVMIASVVSMGFSGGAMAQVNANQNGGDGLSEFTVEITSSPDEVTLGSTFDVGYEIENIGDEDDRQSIELSVNGTTQISRPTTLSPGQTTGPTFADVPLPDDASEGDTIEVTVSTDTNSNTTELTVVATDESSAPENYDPVGDSAVSVDGLLEAIDEWRSDQLSVNDLLEVIDAWRNTS